MLQKWRVNVFLHDVESTRMEISKNNFKLKLTRKPERPTKYFIYHRSLPSMAKIEDMKTLIGWPENIDRLDALKILKTTSKAKDIDPLCLISLENSRTSL